MKKFLSLIAAVLMGMSAMAAEEVTDLSVDFSSKIGQSLPWVGGGDISYADDGTLTITNDAKIDNYWNYQAQALSGITTDNTGAVYTVTYRIKGSVDGSIHSRLGDWNGGANENINFTTEYQDVTVSYDGVTSASSFILLQWGDYVGEVKIQSIVVKHVPVGKQETYEVPEGCKDLKDFTGTNANWASTVVYPKTFAVQGASFGDGDGSNQGTYVDLTGYEKLSFIVTTGSSDGLGLRCWFWDGSKVVTLYPYPEADYATADFTKEYQIKDPGTYVVNLSGYTLLKGVKAANDWGHAAIKVSLAYATPEATESDEYFVVAKVNATDNGVEKTATFMGQIVKVDWNMTRKTCNITLPAAELSGWSMPETTITGATYVTEGNTTTITVPSQIIKFENTSESTTADAEVIPSLSTIKIVDGKMTAVVTAGVEGYGTFTATYNASGIDVPTSVNSVSAAKTSAKVAKTVKNGRLVIVANGAEYNVAGARMK